MTTEAQRRAHEKLARARKAAGKRPRTFWLSEAASKALWERAEDLGVSQEAALEAMLAGSGSKIVQGLQDAVEGKISRSTTIAVRRPKPRLVTGPVDALTGEPIKPRMAVQKGQKAR